MKQIKTPETDAAEFPAITRPMVVSSELARKLESERNAIREVADRLASSLYRHSYDSLVGEPITWEDRDTDALKFYEEVTR